MNQKKAGGSDLVKQEVDSTEDQLQIQGGEIAILSGIIPLGVRFFKVKIWRSGIVKKFNPAKIRRAKPEVKGLLHSEEAQEIVYKKKNVVKAAHWAIIGSEVFQVPVLRCWPCGKWEGEIQDQAQRVVNYGMTDKAAVLCATID
jgi:hypothetical protein